MRDASVIVLPPTLEEQALRIDRNPRVSASIQVTAMMPASLARTKACGPQLADLFLTGRAIQEQNQVEFKSSVTGNETAIDKQTGTNRAVCRFTL
jgi:hypothetical protein